MFDFTQNIHPLTRDGKSQADRQNLKALSPDTARPDIRDEKQILAYLYEFAKAVIFVNEEDNTKDNWQEFFRTGSSVQLALIAQFDPETLQRDFKDAQMRLADGLEAGNFYPLIDFIFETALTIDRWHQALSIDTEFIDGQLIINENPLRLTIQNLIQSNLQTALKQLIGTANSLSDFKIAPLSIQYQIEQNEAEIARIAEEIIKSRYVFPLFKPETIVLWNINPTDFTLRDTALQTAMNAPNTFKSLAIERLNAIFSTFYKSVGKIVADTEGISIFQPTQMHEPHLGLLYAFLRLFGYAQNDLNHLPKRHLDFYFRQVLGLQPRPFVPDEAHLVFEVNKPFSSVKIAEKTLLVDGKDSQKADIKFASTDELIATRAKIGTLRTLHFGTSDEKKTTLFAAPIANSADGNGAPFPPDVDTSWEVLGSTKTPIARVGLLVASPALRLAEGERTVTFTVEFPIDSFKGLMKDGFEYDITKEGLDVLKRTQLPFDSMKPTSFVSTESDKIKAVKIYYGIDINTEIDSKGDLIGKITQNAVSFLDLIHNTLFDVQLSGKKGWFRPNFLPNLKLTTPKVAPFKTILEIKIHLNPTDQAVVVADPSVLKADFGIKEPLMKLELNHAVLNGTNSFYTIFKEATLKDISLETTVNGVTNFIVQNQNGLLDAKKPFQPFGPQPKAGDYWYIGSDEAFRKQLTYLKLNITWKDLDKFIDKYYKHYSIEPTKDSFTINAATLKQGVFKDFMPSNLPNSETTKLFNFSKLDNFSNDLLTDPSVLTQFINGETHEGFIRLTLNQSFLYEEYEGVVTKRGKEIAVIPPPEDTTMPKFPYTPTIQSMTIDYKAEDTPTNTLQLYHLLPFDETNRVAIGVGDSLLPRFDLVELNPDKTAKPIEGALFIGLQDAQVSENLSLLFQLNEPSADSYLADAKIEWSYLIGNQWHKLNEGEHILSDRTEGFIRSGIMRLVLPFDLSSENTTILPPQYHWLRAVTDARSAATCRVFGVHTQAVKAVFDNKGNDLLRLDVPLAAGSLKKIDEPLAEIKSVTQPYNSFGGRAPETSAAFYVRTSERLRHKGRAITLSDYESLVLSAFPDIYKVKCITHTLPQRISVDAQDKLIAPGYVTVVVIPDLATRPLVERFEPKVSRGRLDDITDFLKSRTAPFVQLKVMNPIFEKIDTSSKITFVKGKNPAFYKNQLELDLKRYLAPWAFDPTAKIEFGGQIFPSAILGFIEQREYVDFVEDFKVSKAAPSVSSSAVFDDEGVLTTTTTRGIFVSGNHSILF